MLRTLAILFAASALLAAYTPGASAQVFKTAVTLPKSDFAISGAPTVFMDDGTNEIALFVYGQYGLGANTNVRVRAGFFEDSNYIGGNFEWVISRGSPTVSFSLGGHYKDDPAGDLTLNLSVPLNPNLDLYGGFDTDLIVDDDPDLPMWIFLGTSYHLIDNVDILFEFNYGFVEIAPEILAAGFVFYF